MDYNTENRIMNNKSIESNAKKALNQYKLEIGDELTNFDKKDAPYLGGFSTRKLVEFGENLLINQYNNNKK